MNADAAIAQRRELLTRKLRAVERLLHHLDYSRRQLAFPLASIDALDDAALESVSALIERFGKLQDLLGNVFREVLLLSGEDATDMNDVLSRLEKIGVLASGDDWRALRALRNLGAHDYDDDDRRKTGFINELCARSHLLTEAAAGTLRYCRGKLGLEPTDRLI